MLEFIRAGGYSAIATLILGFITLGVGGLFVWRPDERRGRVLQALCKATFYSTVGGLCSNLAAVCTKVPANPDWAKSPDIHLIIMQGIAESLTTPILGFTMLALAYLMSAVGQRRQVGLSG